MNTSSQAQIVLEEYNQNWTSMFESEKKFLVGVIGTWLFGTVEHVGSTSVPGLIAKPIIDIMFGVKSLNESRDAIEILSGNGYQYFPYKEDVMHWFCKPSDAHRTHHLHLIPFASPLWKERLLFRDYLREHKAIANDYARLKTKLAAQYKNERELYTQSKWPFIKSVIEKTSVYS